MTKRDAYNDMYCSPQDKVSHKGNQRNAYLGQAHHDHIQASAILLMPAFFVSKSSQISVSNYLVSQPDSMSLLWSADCFQLSTPVPSSH